MHIGKNLNFGGIVSNVQRRIAKNGKEWAIFNLEGYDESFEFKIFNEDYLNFHRYLLPNNFVYFKILVKEGWVNKDTGKKSDPRIQFVDAKQLQDVLGIFAKKLSILLDIKDLNKDFISELNAVFQANKGNNAVTFDVVELETVSKKKKKVSEIVKLEEKAEMALFEDDIPDEPEIFLEDFATEDELLMEESILIPESTVVETKIITRISMPSRKLKVQISNELLVELEKLQVNFKLN